MIKQQPRVRFADIFAALFFFLGYLMFLIVLHVLTINAEGNTQDMLNTTFIIALRVFETLLIFAMVGVVIHFLRYMVWQISTPKWLKEKMKMQ